MNILMECTQKNFIKNELIITDEVNNRALDAILNYAEAFFERYLETEIVKTDIGYDIVSKKGGFELGSYGIRRCDYLEWVYGTGIAEPRLSRVIQSLELNK